ncbi:MAG: epoxyqueuosine reductase [Clostridia bacterium]|nr:epoxyqueuosine reductase [Clostridia bacterium]
MTAADTVRDILAPFSPEIGVCAFDDIRDHLRPCRAMSRIPQNARSVIVMLFPYAVDDPAPRNISRYACVKDYHDAIGAVLQEAAAALSDAFPYDLFVPFVDNSPLPEIHCATKAGLGVKGDHGLFISDRFGSFVFIGCLVTTLALPAANAEDRGCLHCGACAAACPGGCLPGTDRRRCLSALTQKKGALTPEEEALVKEGGLLWGCDRCQEVCPMNAGKPIAPHPALSPYDPWLSEQSLASLEGKAYAWRGEQVLRRNLKLMEPSTK